MVQAEALASPAAERKSLLAFTSPGLSTPGSMAVPETPRHQSLRRQQRRLRSSLRLLQQAHSHMTSGTCDYVSGRFYQL